MVCMSNNMYAVNRETIENIKVQIDKSARHTNKYGKDQKLQK